MIGRHLFSLFKSLGGLFFFVFICGLVRMSVGSFQLIVPWLCSRNLMCWKPLDSFYSSAFSISIPWQLCAPSSGSFPALQCFVFHFSAFSWEGLPSSPKTNWWEKLLRFSTFEKLSHFPWIQTFSPFMTSQVPRLPFCSKVGRGTWQVYDLFDRRSAVDETIMIEKLPRDTKMILIDQWPGDTCHFGCRTTEGGRPMWGRVS